MHTARRRALRELTYVFLSCITVCLTYAVDGFALPRISLLNHTALATPFSVATIPSACAQPVQYLMDVIEYGPERSVLFFPPQVDVSLS